jgi:hypothetical protein
MELQIKKQLITPSIAKNYLEANIGNRPVSKQVLGRYINEMVNGRWKENTGELIKVSKTGKILDGQHRLHAVIKSNCSIYFHVIDNLEDSIFDVIDTGKSRNASDCFSIAQVKRANTIPSIIKQFHLLKSNYRNQAGKQFTLTNSQLLDEYYKNELYWQNVARITHNWYDSFAKILSPSLIGGLYAFFDSVNSQKAEQFMNQLTTGNNISNNVVNLLRNKLMQDKMSPRKMHITIKMALIIKTWNHFVNNKTVALLKFDSVRDEFPSAESGLLI